MSYVSILWKAAAYETAGVNDDITEPDSKEIVYVYFSSDSIMFYFLRTSIMLLLDDAKNTDQVDVITLGL